jgi:hypothetical protein
MSSASRSSICSFVGGAPRQLDRRASRLETLAARAAQPQGPITPEFLSRTIGRARISGFLRQHSNIKVPSRVGRSVARWGI